MAHKKSRKEIAAIVLKLKKRENKHVPFEDRVLLIQNEKNPRTGTYYTELEAKKIASSINRKFVHHYPFNGGTPKHIKREA